MSLDRFEVPKTPESRTPHVLLLLAGVGAVGLAWRLLSGSRLSVEIAVLAMSLAIAYAVVRFLRQRHTSPQDP